MDQSDGTSGFGGTSGSFFHYSVFCPPFTPKPTGHSFRDILDETLQAHYPRGDTLTFPKILGVGPPGGNLSPKFFARFRSENMWESWP